MAYIPGGRKPLNQLETPIYPDIRKGPPRFVWARKSWKVDTGRTMMQVEHIPNSIENATLFQSKSYGSQYAYGKRPTRDVNTVNKEFRPPLIDRDDVLPLSRIPRPLVTPFINPGTAHPDGSGFRDQNMMLPGNTVSFLTDRVKTGEMRPTHFCPLEMPEDNSVLPDLREKTPRTSASAGFVYPIASDVIPQMPEQVLSHKRFHPSVVSGIETIHIDGPVDENRYRRATKNPLHVSALSGTNAAMGTAFIDRNEQSTHRQSDRRHYGYDTPQEHRYRPSLSNADGAQKARANSVDMGMNPMISQGAQGSHPSRPTFNRIEPMEWKSAGRRVK